MTDRWEEAEETGRALLRRGRRVDAWQALTPHHAERWRTGDAAYLQLAHDLASWLGFDTRRHWIGRRIARQHGHTLWGFARTTFDALRRGRVLECYERMLDGMPAAADEEESVLAEQARARVLMSVRDFRKAHAVLDAAEQRHGDRPEIARERAWTLWRQDDTDAALAACEAALGSWPDDPPLLEQRAWMLLQLQRTDEALAALDATCTVVQCPSIELLRADALLEAGLAERCRAEVERTIATMPLDRHQRVGARMLLARALRAAGEDHAALAAIRSAGPRMRKWADRMQAFLTENPTGGGRVVRHVPFVRQDHVTCSPATMAALLAYCGVRVDQREIAARITYDGTASNAELRWAQERGLAIWFFQFDLDVAHRLVDLGLPFAVSTRGEQLGHRQAVCGYDRALGTFVLRDPNHSSLQEVDAAWLAGNMAVRGGDCALLLPQERAPQVPVDLLPHQRATTQLQELREAYQRRDLPTAERIAVEIADGPPSSPRWEAAVCTAYERDDRSEQLRLYRDRYEQHPDDSYWQFHYALALQRHDRWGPFVELLERHVGGRSPHLALLLAEHLCHAAPTRPRAERLLRRAARQLPGQPQPVHALAGMLWSDVARRERALQLYHLCATMAPRDERLADSYFDACVRLGRRDDGLAFLRERVATFGAGRAEARSTLARALEQSRRRAEAIDVLRSALHDADEPHVREQLFDLLLADSQRDAAAALLNAPERWRPLSLQLARRRLALANGDRKAAHEALEAAVAVDPGNASVWSDLLRAELGESGRDAALRRAARCLEEHGDDPRLCVRVQEFFDEIEERGQSEALLRRLVADHPREWWLLGRLCRFLVQAGRAEQASALADTLLAQVPDSLPAALDAIDAADQLGDVARRTRLLHDAAMRWPAEPALLHRRRQFAASAAEAAAAVRDAMASLLADHVAPARADLERIVRAVEDDLGEAEVGPFLERLQERFRDDPEPAAALCRWSLGRDDEAAVAIATRLREDAPWNLQNWLLLTRSLRAAGRRDEERSVLQELVAREPAFAQSWVELGESLEQEGRTEEALTTYRRGLEQSPDDPTLLGMQADLLWRVGAREQALASADRAALLATEYGWVRRVQVLWRAEMGRHEEALAAAEACVRDNPSWPLSHELLASAHQALGNQEARVAALQKALRLAPRVGDARRRLIEALLELRQFDRVEQVVAEGFAVLGDEPDLHLWRLRARRMQGDLVGAREDLRRLLGEHPDFVDGFYELMSWLDDEQRDVELLELCDAPPAALADNPTPLCYAADVRIRRRELAEAERDLRRALELAPEHDWARDRLAQLLLDRGKPRRVLELFPGARDAAQLPFARAALLCESFARAGDRADAERFFTRLLHEPDADIETLRRADRALRKADDARQRSFLERMLDDSETARDVLQHENALVVLVAHGDSSLWPRMDRFAAWLPPDRREASLSRLLYSCKAFHPVAAIDRWVRRHLEPPIADTEAWARIVLALNDEAGARTAARLTDGHYRRQGVRGWMLANLAGVHRDLGEWEQVEQICTHALSPDVPADHSVWWHRRFLAECAYRRGEHARCLELCEMATESFPTVKVRTVQLATLARIGLERTARGRRQRFVEALPEILRQVDLADAARRGPHDKMDVDWWQMFRAAPTLRGLVLALGGRRFFRARRG